MEKRTIKPKRELSKLQQKELKLTEEFINSIVPFLGNDRVGFIKILDPEDNFDKIIGKCSELLASITANELNISPIKHCKSLT